MDHRCSRDRRAGRRLHWWNHRRQSQPHALRKCWPAVTTTHAGTRQRTHSPAHQPTPTPARTHLDPRTTLLAVLLINATALSYGRLPTLLLCITFSALALATITPRYGLLALATFFFFYLGYWALLHLPPSQLFAFTAAMFLWFARFTISMSIGAFALLTLTPSTLNSALRRMRLPAWATIPPVVFLRVLPIIATEARAIRDAMCLRGLQPGLLRWVTRPAHSSAMLIIPLLAAVVRAGDELASSALIRGLGGPAHPSTAVPLSFKLSDAASLLALLLILLSVCVPMGVWH
ncbi:energy-coupling factor transporter transmembrane protein EcfT [Corynebacterium sp. 320]|nr:energy-coupling factor transporter transmembrane protein EcfT [Corynebacterium sp. 320]KAB1552835.1 energy-coupling factor transporter transmembrane protein EcfT [Corynebacterium sp. 321]KAB1553947.1 energy-coupling factor transporter transmembrane protein EcfT [Corynebacterium sp. 319]KAB3528202.1 energy-coupling factor transporter transmembrane protein EcfT [Corynebacterium sp. 250]KAB3540310.1 energy-coupling factor transporter transmembrane protein EcfT [Corynebacterium sp. 366]QNP91743